MSSKATAEELAAATRWTADSFQSPGGEPTRFPLSFRYGDKESASLLKGWKVQRTTAAAEAGMKRETVTLTDPQTGLQCRCEITTFADFPAVEWVAYLKNTGAADTPIIADIQALDATFPIEKNKNCKVHHSKGSECLYDDFEPLETALRAGKDLRIASIGGRSSDGALPFFNVELVNGGVIGAVGWSGGWAASFQRDANGVHVRAGMQQTHLRLHPGEEIRTPSILLLFWEKDRLHGHNMLRRFIIAHHTPKPKGRLLQPPIADAVWGERSEESQIIKARWLKENNIPVDYFWIDAGWYGDRPFDPKSDTFGTAWAVQVGEWYPLKEAYPRGLKPVGDALKSMDLGFVLWVEPERAYQGTRITREHPEWLLGPIGPNYLFNLGNPAALRYLTDWISGLIAESGITCYRQDFNFQPAPYWKANDAPDRVGMSEIRHIEGLYAFWDELLARHPGLIIDNCASGGRRIDLETISRSVPLWRSDVQCWPDFDPIAMQTQTQGLGIWVPLSTGCWNQANTYAARSALGPGLVVGWSSPAVEEGKDLPLDMIRKMLSEEVTTRKYFYGDFYPLLSFTLANDAWAAWQFDRPDLGEGMVLALRRPKSPFPRMESSLHGLDPEARYEWRSLDSGAVAQISGRDLLEKGVSIEIGEKPGSALFIYKSVG